MSDGTMEARALDRVHVPGYLQWVLELPGSMYVMRNYVCDGCMRHVDYPIYNAETYECLCVVCLQAKLQRSTVNIDSGLAGR